jgi:hypothetical protein
VDHEMAYIKQHSWQQQPGESPKAFQAFVIYRNLELKERSLQKVGAELGKSRCLIERWSSRWGWVERAAEWDDYQEMRRLETRIQERQKMDEAHLRAIRAARSKAIRALVEMDPSQLARNPGELRRWVTELMCLERLIMGEPEPIEKRREKIEIRQTIEERLKAYAHVYQELIDEGAIRLDPPERIAFPTLEASSNPERGFEDELRDEGDELGDDIDEAEFDEEP